MMKLICPFDPALIESLQRRSLCVRVEHARQIAPAAVAAKRRNRLDCIIWETQGALADITVAEDWRDLPLALMVPSIGRVRDVVKKAAALRKLELRVHLSSRDLVGARVLASLGIAVALDLDGASDWDGLADLMTYALLGLVPHAPIEPFRTIAKTYQAGARCDDWGHITFDDPTRHLHLDDQGRIALSRHDLTAQRFAADDLSKLDSPELNSAILARSEAWRRLFAENHFCARCPAWRICRGRLRQNKQAPDGCADFFEDMAQVIERSRRKSRARVATWRH